MTEGSRIPGFYRLSIAERRALAAERSGVDLAELEAALVQGGLDAEKADKVVENVLGTYALPFGVALNVRVNGRDHLVPMVVEEPSVIAAASNAARMIRANGGFTAEVSESLMTAQVQLVSVPEPSEAVAHLVSAKPKLMELARAAVPNLLARGGGPREIEVRDLGAGTIVLHVYVDCRDAMGANLVNSIAEAIGPSAAELSRGVLGLRILSNLCDRRRVRVRCRVHPRDLGLSEKRERSQRQSEPPSTPPRETSSDSLPSDGVGWVDGRVVADRIVLASRFAEVDPYRAATHNKGVMNGVDAVVIASGNDFRAVEAGAHAYAARSGRYAPLVVWRRDGDDLTGELEMPLALGTVGGTLRVHPVAQLALKLLRISSADELAMVAASVGMASNLAALRALATEGIQRGHMSLHARSVAVAAGAVGSEVEAVALVIAEQGAITVESAARALAALRS
ncbi:MAG TPA: hydroxymethylglutaryl-CoA reductase [Polyangiaceae bacterium]|nr:hydroxymethylglutaryl-CoA reductase [Polyangiaceae bacterium]